MKSPRRLPKASPKKSFPSDPFLAGLNVEVFTEAPVSLPESQAFGEPHPAGYVPSYEIVGLEGSLPAQTEKQAMGILRTVSRVASGVHLGLWHLLNRNGKQWRRARWTHSDGYLIYTVEEITNGQIRRLSEERIDETDDIGI